jgi:hypothetical protein
MRNYSAMKGKLLNFTRKRFEVEKPHKPLTRKIQVFPTRLSSYDFSIERIRDEIY